MKSGVQLSRIRGGDRGVLSKSRPEPPGEQWKVLPRVSPLAPQFGRTATSIIKGHCAELCTNRMPAHFSSRTRPWLAICTSCVGCIESPRQLSAAAHRHSLAMSGCNRGRRCHAIDSWPHVGLIGSVHRAGWEEAQRIAAGAGTLRARAQDKMVDRNDHGGSLCFTPLSRRNAGKVPGVSCSYDSTSEGEREPANSLKNPRCRSKSVSMAGASVRGCTGTSAAASRSRARISRSSKMPWCGASALRRMVLGRSGFNS